jgi:hypothetical protein
VPEVGEESERATRYRDRSDELKRLAQTTRSHRIRRALLDVAKDYDKIAEMIEAAETKATELRERGPKGGSPGSSCP